MSESTESIAGTQASDQFVQSLARGLAVIRSFDADHTAMTLSEVSRRTGLTRATARRFLLTLVELGYVRTDGRIFELTALVLQLGYAFLAGQTLPQLVQPMLEDLSRETHESTSAAILDDLEIVYIARIHTRRIMTVGITAGTRFPAYATSMGRVMLAALDAPGLEDYLARAVLEPLTPKTKTSKDELRAELARVREQGFAINDQELELGLRSVAVPVRDPAGRVIAALNLAMQTSFAVGAVDAETAAAPYIPRLQAVSERITEALGARH